LTQKKLTFSESSEVIEKLGDLDIVLVGGQALACWVSEYQHAPELQGGLFASKDIDFQGTQEHLYESGNRFNVNVTPGSHRGGAALLR
jgi:hypothetical protein